MTAKELEQAVIHRRKLGGCFHTPGHTVYAECVQAIATALRRYR